MWMDDSFMNKEIVSGTLLQRERRRIMIFFGLPNFPQRDGNISFDIYH